MDIAIVSAVRTVVAKAHKGCFAQVRPENLAAACWVSACKKVPQIPLEAIEDVVLGCAMPEAEQGLNLARQTIFVAHLPESISACTINRFCASGLQAIAIAAGQIAQHQMSAVLAGGVESMSCIPMRGNKVRLHPDLIAERPGIYIGMGHTAERIAKKYQITRAQQDEFAWRSHQKAAQAWSDAAFAEQLVEHTLRPFYREDGPPLLPTANRDECIRPDTNLESLSKLRPAFSAEGTVTAGNSSPLSDGAAGLLLLSDEQAKNYGVRPMGFLRAFATAGVAPETMGIGPVPAIRKLLERAGIALEQIDLFEINEAFAAQVLAVQQELQIPPDKLNIHGGAIALGHPLGCSGAKLTVQMLHTLRQKNLRYGVVSMCVGGGMGVAALFEAALD
jgi:acetyl-CoA acyltransferase